MYLLPMIPSFFINLISLKKSLPLKTLFQLFFAFPQYLISPCFSCLMFEGVTVHDQVQRKTNFKLKLWKIGSIINAVYIILVPQAFLVCSDVWRGVTKWKFTRRKDIYEAASHGFVEKNSALIKHQHGNVFFSIAVSLVSLIVLVFLLIKLKKLFVQASDVLATRTDDTTSWAIGWNPEISSTNGQANETEVFIKYSMNVVPKK